nr:hypothetical protein GCM10020241_40760 [Streptoalloteichus tenebrarius]
MPTTQRSTRRSRFGFVVPRVGTPSARARPAASRGARFLLAGAVVGAGPGVVAGVVTAPRWSASPR